MPARCPSCNQVYTDESLSFCPNDGTPLVKDAPPSYDPQATMIAQPPPAYQPQQPPPPQQGYYAPQGGQVPPQGWQQPPYGQQQFPPQYGVPPAAGGKSKLPLIIAIAAVVLIAGGVGLFFLLRDNSSSTSTTNSRSNNNNSTTTSSTPSRTTSNTSTTTPTFPTPTTATTNTSTTTSSSDYSDDEKHKLFQAVGITKDNALIVEVAQKLGLFDSSGQPLPALQPFIKDHFAWAIKNAAWVNEYKDPVKAREYVMEHK